MMYEHDIKKYESKIDKLNKIKDKLINNIAVEGLSFSRRGSGVIIATLQNMEIFFCSSPTKESLIKEIDKRIEIYDKQLQDYYKMYSFYNKIQDVIQDVINEGENHGLSKLDIYNIMSGCIDNIV